MTVNVVAPDPAWRQSFAHEALRIRAAVGGNVVALHHIGSTAINEIYAKPIVDILLVVSDLELLDSNAVEMKGIGYEAKGEFGIPGRRYFRKNDVDGTSTHHLHSFLEHSAEAARHLAFRDYMNAHPAAALAYSALKRNLALSHPHSMEAYMDGKDAFIKSHEALALAWKRDLAEGKR
jgi:GrpB-like predicted nucleotidyltransferase (UPF0157 family)